jgi:hypothetical protein
MHRVSASFSTKSWAPREAHCSLQNMDLAQMLGNHYTIPIKAFCCRFVLLGVNIASVMVFRASKGISERVCSFLAVYLGDGPELKKACLCILCRDCDLPCMALMVNSSVNEWHEIFKKGTAVNSVQKFAWTNSALRTIKNGDEDEIKAILTEAAAKKWHLIEVPFFKANLRVVFKTASFSTLQRTALVTTPMISSWGWGWYES